MRVLVVGAGGVGGFFGARLARAGTRVTVLARGPHLDALRRHGIRVRSAVEGEFSAPVEAVEAVGAGTPFDAVLLCVKSYDTESAVTAIRPAIGPDTGVLSLQNGVDNEATIDAVLGPGHAIGGAAYVFAAIESPGVIAHRTAGRVVLGELDGRPRPRTERLRDAFAAAGVPVEVAPDITRVLWEKYVMISAQAGVTALSRSRIGLIRDTPPTWRLYRTIAEELAALARAAGVRLADDVVETVMKFAAALPAEATSSLHHDLTQGKRLELEALHGHAVRLGERLGVATPAVFAVYAALRPWADGAGARPGG